MSWFANLTQFVGLVVVLCLTGVCLAFVAIQVADYVRSRKPKRGLPWMNPPKKRTEKLYKLRTLHYTEYGALLGTAEVPRKDFPKAHQDGLDELGLEDEDTLVLPIHFSRGVVVPTFPDGSGATKKLIDKLEDGHEDE